MPHYPKDGIDITDPKNLDADGFLKGHLHRLIILGDTFPMSGLVSDMSKSRDMFIKYFCYGKGWELETVSIFITLLTQARSELSLKIKLNLYKDDDSIPLSHKCFLGVGSVAFTKYLSPLVTEVVSATQRKTVTDESFNGKYFLYVRGRNNIKSTFYFNYVKLSKLGKLMGFIPFNDIDYKVKGIKTQLKNNT
jgi:hypothetical protein